MTDYLCLGGPYDGRRLVSDLPWVEVVRTDPLPPYEPDAPIPPPELHVTRYTRVDIAGTNVLVPQGADVNALMRDVFRIYEWEKRWQRSKR